MTAFWIWFFAALRKAAWIPVAAFLLHLLHSTVLGTYGTYPHMDVPMHLLGGVAIAYFFWKSVSIPEGRPVLGPLTPFGRFLLALTALGSSTVLWEFFEWTGDFIGLSDDQAGLKDTMFWLLRRDLTTQNEAS
ncbi:MAG: hypothetical protein P1U53_15910 [Sulfitobacter sp.]|nr:hypothetical protein [Sulfitobacter sp.]